MSPLNRFIAAVTAAGLGVLAVGLSAGAGTLAELDGPLPWVFAALLVVGECVPMRMVHDGSEGEITTSSTFAMALLIVGGAPATFIALALAALVADALNRKSVIRALFNVGQYSLSIAASALVLGALTGSAWDTAYTLTPEDLFAYLAAALAFFVVNAVLVARAVSLAEGQEFWGYLKRDLALQTSTVGILLGIAPIVVITASFSLVALPLLGLPLLALRSAGRQSVASAREAMHDALTGLPNRALFGDRVDQTLRMAARDARGFAVMLVDLDGFKEVNDTLGHHAGDVLLCGVAERLLGALRDSDTVARLGGDEFAIVLPRVETGPEALEVAAKLRDAIERPFDSHGLTLDVGASVGIALYPEDGTDGETLLRRADVAMYRAKDTQAGHQLYVSESDPHSPERLRLVGELRPAALRGEVVPFFQPKLDLRNGRVEGFEALLRWRHPRHGLLLPADFIPAAERSGLIGTLTEVALDAGLRECRVALDAGRQMSMAVNLSARSLLDDRIVHDVARLLARWDVPGEALQLELTESMIVTDPERAREVLEQMRAMGVGIALDDFGTGYSSLAQLKDLPVDELKVDRSFVARVDQEAAGLAIVRSTVQLAHDLGLRVVAEGVETAPVLAQLRSLGCDAVQGFLFGRPVPSEELLGALAAAEQAMNPAGVGSLYVHEPAEYRLSGGVAGRA